MCNEQLRVASAGILLVATVTGISVAARAQVQTQETRQIRTNLFQPGVPIAERLLPDDEIVLVKQRRIDHSRFTAPQSASRRVRTIPYRPGIALETRLLPDDQVVIVKQEPGLFVLPSGKQTRQQKIAYLTRSSDVVVVAEVTDVVSALTTDKSWINTRVDALAEEVLISRKRPVVPGQQLDVEYEGGTLTIGSCRVTAGEPLKVEAVRRYLLFLVVRPETGAMYLSGTPLMIDNGKLVNPWFVELGSPARDVLHGLTLEQVAKEVRRFADK